MKRVFIILAVATITSASCNNNTDTASIHKNHDTAQASETSTPTSDAKSITPTFANVAGGVANHTASLFDHYIHVKTALVNSDAKEAQNGAAALVTAVKGFDRSLLQTEHKEAYDKNISGIRSTAEAIAGTKELAKQREQFAQLSLHAYSLAKAFGGGKTLYHDHCPMAFNEKGAMWLSEKKEIRNPYYGKEMLECGTVEERIEKP